MKQKKFDWGYFLKHIAIIAVPVALQNLLTTTGSMVDTIMLASIGEKAVGAIGLCAQFSSLMFSGYWGFIGGGMLFFAQYWGAKDDEGITRSYGMTLLFMMTVGLVFAALAICAPEFVMGVYTDKAEIQAIGISYLRIVGFAYPLQILAMAMSALLRSIEQVRIPLYGGIASVVANCFFNYLFIFGKCGLPKMGASGAAVGTVLAGIVNLLVLISFVLHKKIPYVLEFSKHFRWTRSAVAQYLEKCFPIICNEVLIGVGNMLINVVLGRQTEQPSPPWRSSVPWRVWSLPSSAAFPMRPPFSSERKSGPEITRQLSRERNDSSTSAAASSAWPVSSFCWSTTRSYTPWGFPGNPTGSVPAC